MKDYSGDSCSLSYKCFPSLAITFLLVYTFASFVGTSVAGTSTLHSIVLPKSQTISKERLKTSVPPHAASQSNYLDTVVSKTSSSSKSHSAYADDPYYHPSPPLPPVPHYNGYDRDPSQWRHPSHDSWSPHHDVYPHHHHHPHHEHKGHDHMVIIPVLLGGAALLLIPLMTLFLTLMVNVAPATNIPTAMTTATVGKRSNARNSTQFMDLLRRVDDVISNSVAYRNEKKSK